MPYRRDGRRVFELADDHPYTSGHFAFRTTAAHWRLRAFAACRLVLR